MTEADLALALGAGMLAAVNPCGFALLPAYLSLLVLGEESTSPTRAGPLEVRMPASRFEPVGRALALTAAMTAGFVLVFGVFGLVIAPIASTVQQHLPWVTVVLGCALMAAGIWLLTGRSLPAFGWSPRGPKIRRSLISMLAFGAAYAMASLTCTIAPFLAVVAASFRTSSALAGSALFVVYALGMGLVVGTAAVAVALAKSSVIDKLRRGGRFVPLLAGVLMVCVGAYVAYYGWWEIRVLRGAATDDPVIEAAGAVQQAIANAVAAVGAWWFAVILLVVLAAVALIAVLRRRLRNQPEIRGNL